MSSEAKIDACLVAPDRETLLPVLDGLARRLKGPVEACDVLELTASCGRFLKYTREEIPEVDVECYCGTKETRHWFIRYLALPVRLDGPAGEAVE